MKVFLTVLAVLLATLILITSNQILSLFNLVFSENAYLNTLLKYQILISTIAISFLIVTIGITPKSKSLFRFGNMNTIAIRERWLGINGKSSWGKNALQLAFFISLATSFFMFLAVKYSDSLMNFDQRLLPFILLISFTNAFSEEIIYRFSILGNLIGKIPIVRIFLLSAILFGIPHFFGFPSGIIGVIMSGALGYILSKATYETNGIGIAVSIHFIQDIIIFTGLLMINA